MIDYAVYRRLHGSWNRPLNKPGPYDTWPEHIHLDAEIDLGCRTILPPNIHSFDIKEKEWKNLHVEHVKPITWDKRAYQRLVLPRRTKELVQSLVMVRRSKRGTQESLRLAGNRNDVINGKGNGLIMLLHGGPGTGKTLTAESVAELAEMPLYSITCGDIGTNAEAVEKYLQTILYLGKAWNCVLLLDEADVFLEERTLSDLERNSMVSVFLRTLEYYEGILILTSNRVGTFDEAFKSRIQVALHYPALDTPSRRRIWQNFFDMLAEEDLNPSSETRSSAPDVDKESILEHLDELAEHEMNGRQIRNVLTTAWQIALFKGEMLSWTHIEHSLVTAEQFNVYLRKLQGVKDEDRMRDEKVR
ncbi:P-loop containing nucleoside triphosphate hydrolase protein [Polyplosphaeria fusca]|uniref:P-loop containing nucleoside triphosphate hydrolase protein n=1 Tax=Polyplosphaeria fusca TaxID=682080 RepID=A0A9P4R4V9_9PLEO|nr:P-loop containing nucleoside triphosphate hydrolase protein [Polyplosphaeria fusca]